MMPGNLKLDGVEVIYKACNGGWNKGRSEQLKEQAGVFQVDAQKLMWADFLDQLT